MNYTVVYTVCALVGLMKNISYTFIAPIRTDVHETLDSASMRHIPLSNNTNIWRPEPTNTSFWSTVTNTCYVFNGTYWLFRGDYFFNDAVRSLDLLISDVWRILNNYLDSAWK